MQNTTAHTFHIPVMGLGFTIDTPLKVAKYGITSVVSIMEDHLIEDIRKKVAELYRKDYQEMGVKEFDYRAKRITAYLDLLNEIVQEQIQELKELPLGSNTELDRYFEMLPSSSVPNRLYKKLMECEEEWEQKAYKDELLNYILSGNIEVNIMTKLDKLNYDSKGDQLPTEHSDALSALRGFCSSSYPMGIVLSAGMNPRLFAYCEEFAGFFPDENGIQQKKIILKVSDYRSAYIQGKIFAKKGILISEFRIESGLNCGGHAFATQGYLFGPILEEFKQKKNELQKELFEECQKALQLSGKPTYLRQPKLKITAQGGIGTNEEDSFLLNYFELNGTGWGSPFLLVPETTNVDQKTLDALIDAEPTDFYLSDSSPLGVRFNNFRKSSADLQRKERIEKNKPGSPCYKEFLVNNTEFTEKPICTASRQYQKLKIDQIRLNVADQSQQTVLIDKVMEKECLCEGLGTSARIVTNAPLSHKIDAVSICPGPNLSFFGRTYELKEMIDHIYGKTSIIFKRERPNIFVNEARMYIDYLKAETVEKIGELTGKQVRYYNEFKVNLENGLEYYKGLADAYFINSKEQLNSFLMQIDGLMKELKVMDWKEAEV